MEILREKEDVIDPRELVEDLANRIGIHQLYAIVCEIRGESADLDKDVLIKDFENMKLHRDYLERKNTHLEGVIEGLKFAIRCDGVSGAEIKE